MTISSTDSPAVATPILDSGMRPKRAKRKRLGNTLLGFASGLLFAAVLIWTDNSARDAKNPAAGFSLFFFFLAIILSVAVHEGGHLLAGWSVGFRFSFISVGPLSLRLEYGRLKLHLRRGMPAAGYAGMHVNRVSRLRLRLLVFTVAGPLANLLSVALTIIFLDYIFPTNASGWLYLPAHLFLQISLILGLVNLVPFRLGMLFNDGSRIAMLLWSRTRSRRWMCITAVGNQSQQGVRPRHWRSTWVRGTSSLHDGSVDDFAGNWISYVRANDRQDAPLAASHLEKCLELMNQVGLPTQDLVALEAAVFLAWFRNDPMTAQKWAAQVKKLTTIPQLLRIRAEVALPCARMEYDQALTAWQRGLAFIEAMPVSAAQKQLKNGWQEWQGEILERQLKLTAIVPDQNSLIQTGSALA